MHAQKQQIGAVRFSSMGLREGGGERFPLPLDEAGQTSITSDTTFKLEVQIGSRQPHSVRKMLILFLIIRSTLPTDETFCLRLPWFVN